MQETDEGNVMIRKEDLKQEIEQLDLDCLELVFRLLQQFPHQKNVNTKVNPLNYSRPIHYAGIENNGDLAFSDIEDATTYGKQLRTSLWQRNNNHD
ncbi:MAG: hypothetical protein V3U92_05635 [Cellulophaga sp.]